jgi:hypothetical protein
MIEDVLSSREQAQLFRGLPKWNVEPDEPFIKLLEDMEVGRQVAAVEVIGTDPKSTVPVTIKTATRSCNNSED